MLSRITIISTSARSEIRCARETGSDGLKAVRSSGAGVDLTRIRYRSGDLRNRWYPVWCSSVKPGNQKPREDRYGLSTTSLELRLFGSPLRTTGFSRQGRSLFGDSRASKNGSSAFIPLTPSGRRGARPARRQAETHPARLVSGWRGGEP